MLQTEFGDKVYIGQVQFTIHSFELKSQIVRLVNNLFGIDFSAHKSALEQMGAYNPPAIDPAQLSFPHVFMAPDHATFKASGGFFGADPAYSAPVKTVEPKCECGSAALGSSKHSDWCPLYKLQEGY